MQLLVSILACALPFLTTVDGVERKPSFYSDSISSDAGTVTQGEVIKQVFAFSNRGTGTLEILNVQHS
jgi:hypothetical protein